MVDSLPQLRRHGASLLGGVFLYHLLAAGVLFPLWSLVLQWFIGWSGRDVLADTDILMFVLHPIGWFALLVMGAGLLSIAVLQQATLLHVLAMQGARRLPFAVVATMYDARRVFAVAIRVVGWSLLWSLPFLAAIGLTYLMLLTQYDINYYLAVRPSAWWWALGIAGCIVLVWAMVLVPRILSWYLAFPLVMFESVSARESLAESARRMRGRRSWWLAVLATWFVSTSAIGFVLTGAIGVVGDWLLPDSIESLPRTVFVIGVLSLLWLVVQLLLTLTATAWHAVLWVRLIELRGIEWSGRDYAAMRGTRLEGLLDRVPWVAGGLLAASLLAIAAGVGVLRQAEIEDRASVTAHRGASGEAPENTLAAFRLAIEQRADWVELDVQLTADRQVVVFHDRDLKKVAGVDLVVTESTLAELKQVDIGTRSGREFEGERIPTLAEALEVCRGKVGVNIELKLYGSVAGLEEKVVEVVERHGRGMPLVFMSLKADSVRRLKELRPQWKVGLLAAVAVGDLTRIPADFYAVNAELATAPFVAHVHAQDKEIYVWTVNDPLGVSQMAGRGVDSLITDFPAMVGEVLRVRAEMSPVERLLLELAPAFGVQRRLDVNREDA